MSQGQTPYKPIIYGLFVICVWDLGSWATRFYIRSFDHRPYALKASLLEGLRVRLWGPTQNQLTLTVEIVTLKTYEVHSAVLAVPSSTQRFFQQQDPHFSKHTRKTSCTPKSTTPRLHFLVGINMRGMELHVARVSCKGLDQPRQSLVEDSARIFLRWTFQQSPQGHRSSTQAFWHSRPLQTPGAETKRSCDCDPRVPNLA